jgi:hypothetical protein
MESKDSRLVKQNAKSSAVKSGQVRKFLFNIFFEKGERVFISEIFEKESNGSKLEYCNVINSSGEKQILSCNIVSLYTEEELVES